MDKLLHHINVIKINYANTVTNTVKHTISIIISLLFSLNLTQEPSRLQKYEKKFFLVNMFITLPLSSSKDNKQTNHTCNFF